ncbi:glycosyl hydrolase family 25 [Lactiplantibacillus fabifermentans T30PCM01]|uniref:Lysin n=2 Tax=Lactiplantibacillus fabifermentans TaxID=483011 RepID=A0A0R2NSL9_9LACO|nr:glycosyl hydrolase family 25 [Lactiplantibacillus fabifermentans T30PCM01]KRO27021.1 lysin [Lactiplantibacillus fabifermentans DSM 21115]
MGAAKNASAAVPDISEWQGKLTSTQVKSLKKQASFVINRVQYGSGYIDKYHTSNESLYVKYGVPFGSYDYSTFTSTATAKQEAINFYNRSNKNTRFYVLDFETTNMSSSAANAAVKAWYTEMRKLTKKHLIFYSYQSFATQYANSERGKFDAQWIANYSNRPTVPFSLWQYSSTYYLSSLNLYVDNSLYDKATVTNYHPLSWWTSTSSSTTKKTTTTTAAKPAATTTSTNKTTTSTPAKVNYAFSKYSAGQDAYLKAGATNYYGGEAIPSSVRGKMYGISQVKSVTTAASKQVVYLVGLNKWVLAQDVDGYWQVGKQGTFKLRFKANIFNDVKLKNKSGRTVAKNASVTGKVVKSGKYYRIKIANNGGYITAKVSESAFTPVNYAYSSYTKGQHAYLLKSATHYTDGSAIPNSVKQKHYTIGAINHNVGSRSKEQLYLPALHKTVWSQDVNGYYVGQHGGFTLKWQTANVFTGADLKTKTGKTLKKGEFFSGKVVKYGNVYRIKLNSGGYISASVQAVVNAYHETMPGSKQVKTKNALYEYKSTSFKKSTRSKHHAKGATLKVKKVGKRKDGTRYFQLSNGHYITARKSSIAK